MHTALNNDEKQSTPVWEASVIQLFQKVNFGVLISKENGSMVWANACFCQLTGFTETEIKNRLFTQVFSSAVPAPNANNLEQINGRRMQCFHKQGHLFDVELSVSIPDNPAGYLIWYLKDLSRETRLSGELMFRENMFQTIFNNSFNACLITTLDGHILETNSQASDLFKYSKKDFKKLNRSDLILNDVYSQAYFAELNNHEKGSIVVTCKKSNGDFFKGSILSQTYYNHTGDFFMFTQIEDLSRSERLESIIHETNSSSLTGYFEFNCLTGEHTFTNMLKQILELPMDYLPDIGSDIRFVKDGENRFRIRKMIAGCMADGKPREGVVQIHSSKGAEKWVKINLNADRVKGICARLFGTFQDITEQKKLYSSIHKTTSEFNTILESVADIIIVLDEEGIIRNINKSCMPVWGFSAEELINQPITFLATEEEQSITRINLERSKLENTTGNFENTCIGRNGEKVYMSWSIRWGHTEKQHYLVGRDITQRIREESDKKFLAMLYANDSTGAVRTDALGNIIWMNTAFEFMTGYTIGEIRDLEDSFSFLFGVKTDRETVKRIKEQAGKGVTSTEEIIIYHKNRTFQWVQLLMAPIHSHSGILEGWLVSFKDISQKKSEEYRMKLLQTVMDNAYDSIMITEGLSKENGERYRIMYVNDVFEQQTGYSKEEVIGRTPSFLQGDETDKATRKMIREKLEQWEPFTAELINYKKNGAKFWNSITFIPVANEKGGYKTWISIQHDITREKSQQALKKAQEAEIKKEITKALIKGEDNHRKLMSMELHDNVGQLLTGIKLFLTHFRKNKKEEYLDESLIALDQSIKEIRNLCHSMSIPDIFEDALIPHIENELKKLNSTGNIHFSLHTDLDPHCLHLELSVNIYRIIQEQINNILKYSKATKAEISLIQDGYRLQLRVSDNGVGFNTHDKPNGIGLKNMRTRASLFNGTMKIYSKPGAGCCLEITLDME